MLQWTIKGTITTTVCVLTSTNETRTKKQKIKARNGRMYKAKWTVNWNWRSFLFSLWFIWMHTRSFTFNQPIFTCIILQYRYAFSAWLLLLLFTHYIKMCLLHTLGRKTPADCKIRYNFIYALIYNSWNMSDVVGFCGFSISSFLRIHTNTSNAHRYNEKLVINLRFLDSFQF